MPSKWGFLSLKMLYKDTRTDLGGKKHKKITSPPGMGQNLWGVSKLYSTPLTYFMTSPLEEFLIECSGVESIFLCVGNFFLKGYIIRDVSFTITEGRGK